jgi:hypothetical protein
VSELFDLLAAVRSFYVDQFEAALDELRAQGKVVLVEPPMIDERGELAREGASGRSARHDLAILEGEVATPSMFSPGRMLEFEPIGFAGGGLEILIAPFSWDAAHLVIEGEPGAVSAALAQWFDNAIGAPEGVDENGLQHAAHFLSDPAVDGSATRVQADLGTADVDILVDLFDRLRRAGATRVEVGRLAS